MPKLTNKNYFSPEMNMKYIGSSQIKSFLSCESKALAELKGEYVREKSTALLVGSYVDSEISGELEEFKLENPEIFTLDKTFKELKECDIKFKDFKTLKELQESIELKELMSHMKLKSDYIQAEKILERMKKDKLFMKYLNGNHQTIFSGEIEGIKIKVKIDSYHKNKAIVDLKVLKSFEKIWNDETKTKENPIDYWKYTWQGALYQEIVRQNTGKQLPFFICAITKEQEPDLAVMQIPQDVLDEKLELIKSILPRISEIKKGTIEPHRCEKCSYCRSTKVLTELIDYRKLGD